MGSPTIFSGRRTKLLTADGILTKEGRTLDYDGEINYIGNGNAEINALGWATYADTAGVAPVDGTGGTATNITWSRTTSDIIRGNASFLFSKTGLANCQGKGVSYTFPHPGLVEGNTISFEYQVLSGTYADGDIRIYIVDVTTGAVIEPVNVKLANVGVISKHIATFQTNLNTTTYRLCIHVASTTTQNFDLLFDTVQVGPRVTALSGRTIVCEAYKNGGSVSANTTIASWTGVRVDTANAFNATTGEYTVKEPGDYFVTFHMATTDTTQASSNPTNIRVNGSTQRTGVSGNGAQGEGLVVGLLPGLIAGDVITFTSTNARTLESNNVGTCISITKINSNAGSSADSGRVVAFSATSTSTVTASATAMVFPTVEFDTFGGYNSSTGVYTCKESGYYLATIANAASSGTAAINLVKNGAKYEAIAYVANSRESGSILIDCVAGDTLAIGSSANFISDTTTRPIFSVHKIQGGASAITPGETMAAAYTNVSQSIPNASATIVDFSTKLDGDTHSAVTTGASWKYTAQSAGWFQVSAAVRFVSSTGWTGNERLEMVLYRQGSTNKIFDYRHVDASGTGSAIPTNVGGSGLVYLLSGEYIDIRVTQNSGAALALSPNSYENWISVVKVG